MPGTHDVYDRSSVYRAYDMAALAGVRPAEEMVTVLTPDHPWIHLAALDAIVHGPCFPTKRAPYSPLHDLAAVETPPAKWHVGVLHTSVAIPGRTDHDEVVVTVEEIAASGLDYLALGHWHSAQVAKTKGVTYAYAGAPEPVAVDQDKAGKVLLVTLDDATGQHVVSVDQRVVGKTRFERREIDAATVDSQPALVAQLAKGGDPDLVLDVRLIGVRPDGLDLDMAEVEQSLRGTYLRVRVRDVSHPALTEGVVPPPETIAGSFIRNVEGRIASLEASGRRPRPPRGRRAARRPAARPPAARGLRGDAVRIKTLSLTDLRRYRDRTFELAPGLTIVRGPNEAGKSTIQRAIEIGLTRKVTSSAADLDGLLPWNGDPDARTTIAMTFSYEDEDGVARDGSLTKSFRGAKGTVSLDLGGDPITDPARADEELAAISGVPTEGFFRSTASVRHHELAGLQRDEGALRDRLQASISGADRGTSRAKRKLERAIHDLQTRGIKNPGRLKVAEDAVTETTAQLQAGEDALQRLEHDRDALAVARDHRAEAETALLERRSMLEKARQAERLTAERDAAQDRYERYRTAVTVRDELAELERTHPSPIPLPVLRTSVDRLRTVDSKIATLQALLEEGEVHVEYGISPSERWRPLSRWSMVLVLIGIAISAVSFLLLFADILSIGIIPIIIGGAVALIGARARGGRLVAAPGGTHLRASPGQPGEPPAPRPVGDRAGAPRGAGRARRRPAAARGHGVRGGRGAPGPRGGARRARSSSGARISRA